jgi:Helix-hairpin-helix domain
MAIRIECDWCREPITKGDSYITLAIDGRINHKDVSGPARVFCGGSGKKDEQSCGTRLLALLDGNPGGRVDMGMEWQLVEVSTVVETEEGQRPHRTPAPTPVSADADLDAFLQTITKPHGMRTRNALRRAGLTTLEEIHKMSDDDLMELEGIGWALRTKLRAFIKARFAAQVGAGQAAPGAPSVGGDLIYDVTPSPDGDERHQSFRVRSGYRKYLPNNLYAGSLYAAGIRTVSDLRRAVEDGSILEVREVGRKTAARIADVLDQFAPVEGVPA